MRRWIFFDIGNVLFNDDPQTFAIFERYHRALAEHRPDYSFADMMAERESRAGRGATWGLHQLAHAVLTPEVVRAIYLELREELRGRYDQFHLENQGLRPLLERCAQRYRLGIIANQPPECRASLARRGLLDFFDVFAISEELDLHKPDPALFAWALAQADIAADQAVMVGDRVDNDIEPARVLGMRTVRIRWPDPWEKSWSPTEPAAIEFLRSCARVPVFPPKAGIPDADLLVDVLEQVDAVLDGNA